MKEIYSIKDGRTELVMWIVCFDGHFVIEERPKKEQGESRCIPCGHIDLNRDKGDYIESAFLRESQEEFAEGNFKPTGYKYLTEIDFDEPKRNGRVDKLKIHYYVINRWKGRVPDYTTENGRRHADLVWLPIKDYKDLPQSCDREALEILLKQTRD